MHIFCLLLSSINHFIVLDVHSCKISCLKLLFHQYGRCTKISALAGLFLCLTKCHRPYIHNHAVLNPYIYPLYMIIWYILRSVSFASQDFFLYWYSKPFQCHCYRMTYSYLFFKPVNKVMIKITPLKYEAAV